MEYSDYLDLAVQLIATNEKPGAPFPAAALGGLLRQAAPDVRFKDFGKRALSEVLEDLRARGNITITTTDKGALALERVFNADAETTKPADSFNPLRKVMWEAFTFTGPLGRRFLHRLTGSIRAGLNAPPAPADEWVEITPISAETQRTWAVDFVQELPLEIQTEMRPVIGRESWSGFEFMSALREQDPQAARKWNNFRSARVAKTVLEWLNTNALPPSWAFQQQAAPGASIPAQPLTMPPSGEQETREILLAALAQLPLGKLLEIPIPAGLILNVLSSRNAR